MLGPVNYVIWLAILLAELFSLVCLVKKRAFSQHFTLVLYLCACIAADIASYSIIETSGYDSNAYFYFYFYSQSLLTICLYFVLMNLYSHVFSEMGVGNYIRAGAMLLLSGTAGISYYMVTASSNRLVTHFVVELGQNLYFVGRRVDLLALGRNGETAREQVALDATRSLDGRLRELVRRQLRS